MLVSTPAPVKSKLSDPVVPDAKLSVLWVGHATVLLQLDDKFILTDPIFTETVGQISRRLVEVGLDVENLPSLDAVVVSHAHFDHLSLGSLDLIEEKMEALLVPKGMSVYVPYSKPLPTELATWQVWEEDGLKITAVPVGHSGWRYAGDEPWMKTSYTGFMIEYQGKRVYFGGDTAFVPDAFEETGRRFGPIDLALIPIAPINPRSMMCSMHMTPEEAVQAFDLLGAKWMVPIHFDTFINSIDQFGEAPRRLDAAASDLPAGALVRLAHGERRVFLR